MILAIIYGKNRTSKIDGPKKSYALLSELNDVVDPDYMNLNEI